MVDTMELKGAIARKGYSQTDVAKALGITRDTFYHKMKAKKFNTDEVSKMIKLLGIDDPISIFFT